MNCIGIHVWFTSSQRLWACVFIFTPQHSLYSNSRTNINCFHAREYEIKNHNGMYYQKSVILPGTIKADQTNQQSE